MTRLENEIQIHIHSLYLSRGLICLPSRPQADKTN